jgi:hypothetical protein
MQIQKDWKDVPEEDMVMPAYARNRGIAYLGSNERLRAKLDKLKGGQNISIAAVGGSITAGQNVLDGVGDIWVRLRPRSSSSCSACPRRCLAAGSLTGQAAAAAAAAGVPGCQVGRGDAPG